jgi:hypothetical protein
MAKRPVLPGGNNKPITTNLAACVAMVLTYLHSASVAFEHIPLIIQPLFVRFSADNQYETVAGERRYPQRHLNRQAGYCILPQIKIGLGVSRTIHSRC